MAARSAHGIPGGHPVRAADLVRHDGAPGVFVLHKFLYQGRERDYRLTICLKMLKYRVLCSGHAPAVRSCRYGMPGQVADAEHVSVAGRSQALTENPFIGWKTGCRRSIVNFSMGVLREAHKNRKHLTENAEPETPGIEYSLGNIGQDRLKVR